MKWILIIGTGALVLLGGGVGGGLYASNAGMFGGASAEQCGRGRRPQPRPQERAEARAEAQARKTAKAVSGKADARPRRARAATNTPRAIIALEKEFTSNLQDSVHFIQVGIADLDAL